MNRAQFNQISFTIYFENYLDSSLPEAIYTPENWGQTGTIQANGKVFSRAGNVVARAITQALFTRAAFTLHTRKVLRDFEISVY